MNEIRWASFVSGVGTTMYEMARAVKNEEVPGVSLELVLASKPDIGAIQKARELGLSERQIVVVDPNDFKGEDGKVDQYGFGRQILIELRNRNIDFFTQNGWLPMTPPRVAEEFEEYNQHPQRVPEFGGKGMYGVRPHAARLFYSRMAGEHWPSSEPVAQRVSPEYDGGEIVVYQSIPIPNEILTEDMAFAAPALQRMTLAYEHEVQIELLRQINSHTIRTQTLPRLHRPIERTVKEVAEAARKSAITAFPHA